MAKQTAAEPKQPAETAPESSRGRPAQVASDDYRMNWDRIFGPAVRSKRDRSLN
jgi:hypothetical protein